MARKSKTQTEIEWFRGRVKELEKINKSLKKQLRQLEKYQHQYEPLEDVEDARNEDGLYEVKKQNTCQSCGKNELKILDLNIYKYFICTLCGFKEKIIDNK